MVWDFYYETDPVLRHCFRLQDNECPVYYAFDEDTRLFVDTTTTEEQATIPSKTAVHLIGFKLYDISRPPFSETEPRYFTQSPSGPELSVRISVDLAKDIFSFDYKSFMMAVKRMSISKIPMLDKTGYWDVGSATSCWSLSMRKLAIDMSNAPLPPLEQPPHKALTWFEQLRVVYLVVGRAPGRVDYNKCALTRSQRRLWGRRRPRPDTPDHTGLMPLSEYQKLSTWTLTLNPLTDVFQRELETVYRDNNMKVQVQQMVDIF